MKVWSYMTCLDEGREGTLLGPDICYEIIKIFSSITWRVDIKTDSVAGAQAQEFEKL